jgi:stage III sporulation protein AE
MAVTGAISGTADAAASRAARIAISGAVPVVGGILSDAADTVLLSASVLGSGAGMWGMLTVLAIFSVPAIKIGCQYLMLKATGAIASIFAPKKLSDLITDFSGAMGLLLAVTGSVCLMLLISIVCFMKGVG